MLDGIERVKQPFLEGLEAPLLSTLAIILFPLFQLWPMTYLFLRRAIRDNFMFPSGSVVDVTGDVRVGIYLNIVLSVTFTATKKLSYGDCV